MLGYGTCFMGAEGIEPPAPVKVLVYGQVRPASSRHTPISGWGRRDSNPQRVGLEPTASTELGYTPSQMLGVGLEPTTSWA